MVAVVCSISRSSSRKIGIGGVVVVVVSPFVFNAGARIKVSGYRRGTPILAKAHRFLEAFYKHPVYISCSMFFHAYFPVLLGATDIFGGPGV